MPKISLNASKKTKHTPAGEIPVDWGWGTLEAVTSKERRISYGIVQTGESIKNGIPCVRVVDLTSPRLDPEKMIRTSEKISNSYRRTVLQEGDIIFALRGEIGKTAIADKSLVGANLTRGVALLAADIKSATPEFLRYSLEAGPTSTAIQLSINGTSLKEIPINALRKIPIPLPPLPEQRRIADILSTWDRAIETLESIIAAKERRKQALMEQLLSGRKRLPGLAKDQWRKVRMNEILERVFRPIDWHADKPLSLVSLRRRCGGLFRRPDMLGSEYKTQDLHELKTDDFLISKRQVSHGAWGIVSSDFEGSHVSKEYAIFVNKDARKLHMPFFAWLAQMPRMIRLARVASTGVHVEKLIFDPVVFLRESISIPPTIKEQQAIVAILDTADRELTLHRQHLANLRTQKRGLMQKLLTGEVRTKSS